VPAAQEHSGGNSEEGPSAGFRAENPLAGTNNRSI
jgi:hypothetical protein